MAVIVHQSPFPFPEEVLLQNGTQHIHEPNSSLAVYHSNLGYPCTMRIFLFSSFVRKMILRLYDLMLHEQTYLILWYTFNVASFFHWFLSLMTQLTISIFCSWDRLSSCSKHAMYMFAVHSWIACWHLKLHFPPFWFVWTDYWLNWIKSITKKKLKLENE